MCISNWISTIFPAVITLFYFRPAHLSSHRKFITTIMCVLCGEINALYHIVTLNGGLTFEQQFAIAKRNNIFNKMAYIKTKMKIMSMW